MIPTWRELKDISRRQRMDGKVGEAISTLNASLELAMADAPEEVAKICNILADLYVKGGNIESAERMARKSLQYEEVWGRELSGNEHLAT
ncbi:hypothetical protein [Brevifollis gellanilyticus]|uniref:Tetratricopeptide repeat protein n=1 Tax=Brevifollis gellanilyticus TaxID=748831 RepID=A0A512MHL6_9BACT|nr:hypothetical protein [Brevifollis gellanilyticus]GEP46222.1 hypothetical protein BGE01nite_55130 [Brevifollis gellanilyticus]